MTSGRAGGDSGGTWWVFSRYTQRRFWSRQGTFEDDVERCCANSWAPWVHCNSSTLESIAQFGH